MKKNLSLSIVIPLLISSSCPSYGQYKFSGEQAEITTGLSFHRARFLDAETGAFISRDPIGTADNLNTYSYVGGNPVNFTDPKGEFGIFGAAIGAALGGLGSGIYTYYTTGDTNKALHAGAIGAVTGAFVGSGAGIVAAAYSAGSLGVGAAIASSGIISAAGSGVNSAATQFAIHRIDGLSVTDSLNGIDSNQVVTSAAVGGVVGAFGGGLSVGGIALAQSNKAVQTTLSSNLVSFSQYLTQNQGASSATVGSVQRAITAGMANVGRNTAHVGIGVSVANDVVSPLFSPFVEAVVSPYLSSAVSQASNLYSFYTQSGGLFGNQSGVLIDKAATLIESNLADIKGATYDPVSKQIVFLGSNSTPGVDGIDMDYFYTISKSQAFCQNFIVLRLGHIVGD